MCELAWQGVRKAKVASDNLFPFTCWAKTLSSRVWQVLSWAWVFPPMHASLQKSNKVSIFRAKWSSPPIKSQKEYLSWKNLEYIDSYHEPILQLNVASLNDGTSTASFSGNLIYGRLSRPCSFDIWSTQQLLLSQTSWSKLKMNPICNSRRRKTNLYNQELSRANLHYNSNKHLSRNKNN